MEAEQQASDAAGAALSRLSDRERALLALLAEGHTAKSIAARTGSSVASVNEHLRQARRKTGVGSSRELARLLAAQKNCDEKIGLAPGALSPPIPGSRHTNVKGAIVVGSMLAAAVAAAALLHLQESPAAQPAPVPLDPLVEQAMGRAEEEPRRLAERVRSEPRDADWANGAEAALRARYAPLVAEGRIKVLRIICASTVCELVGDGLEKDLARIDATWADLQDSKKNELPRSAYLRWAAGAFGREGRFIFYWVRQD